MKILVTGLSGCVGQALQKELADAGHQVFSLTRESQIYSSGSRSGAHLIAGDLSKPLDTTMYPESIDAVIHAAQSRKFREFPAAASEVFAINTAATLALAQYAVQAGAKAFVYTSTGSVYRPRPNPIAEDGEVFAASFYAASKLAAEALLEPFRSVIAVSIQRLFYVYGPGQKGMLTDGLAHRILNGEAITLQSPDGIAIAPTYSRDAARIALRAAQEGWSGTINVAGPEALRLRQFAEQIGVALGIAPQFIVQDGAPPDTVLPDTSKLKDLVSPETLTPASAGLKLTFGAL